MSKFWNKVKYHFSDEYRIFHHPIYINLRLHRLYKDWYKVRKFYSKPKLVFYKGDTAEREYEYYMYDWAKYFENKLFGIHIEPVGWKTKFGIIEYTHCPEIVCVINKKVRFTIRLESPYDELDNIFYWERILKRGVH